MAETALPIVSLCFVLLLPLLNNAEFSCGGPCQTSGDCSGQLSCTGVACNDGPSVGTQICSGGSGGGGDCQQSGTLTCGDKTYPTYSCSPPVTSPSTAAILTNNDFSAGGDGGAPSECDQQFHNNAELVVALSTGWYDGGSRCNQTIVITAENGMSTTAMVVDECDSMHGCDAEHAGQPPCRYNIVDASNAVWEALGLNTHDGQASITWTMA